MRTRSTKGKVVLAAAGPGDPELVTCKTAKYLRQADVIISDRLVNPEIIRLYASPRAIVIEVGKEAGKPHSTPQSAINALIVKYALQYPLVVRLKGGDVSIFSNILDELETLREHELPYEIVPGVTAALGAAAYAGIPLTARGISTGVRMLTFYKPEVISPDEWEELAKTSDTLVFYMSSQTLSELCGCLASAGMPFHKPVAIIEQATTPVQHVNIRTLEECMLDREVRFLSPTLIIIGDVVNLHPRFNWFSGAGEKTGPEKNLTLHNSKALRK